MNEGGDEYNVRSSKRKTPLKTRRGRVEKTTTVNALVKSTSRDGVKLQDGWCKPGR